MNAIERKLQFSYLISKTSFNFLSSTSDCELLSPLMRKRFPQLYFLMCLCTYNEFKFITVVYIQIPSVITIITASLCSYYRKVEEFNSQSEPKDWRIKRYVQNYNANLNSIQLSSPIYWCQNVWKRAMISSQKLPSYFLSHCIY